MKYFRYGHCDKLLVKLGDKVKKGQKIGTVGTGNGQYSAHLHFDVIKKKFVNWTSYVFGWTLEEVKAVYADPGPYRKTVFPEFDHFGWIFTEYATYGTKHCYHPGEDLNGKGAGNSDLGFPVYSACDGEVVYRYNGTGSNGGWGKLLVIKETEEKKDRIDDWCEAIKKHEGWFKGSASYRNNNPGNFRCSSLVMGELGATKCVNNLAVFPNYETGYNALRQFLIYACTDKLRSYKSTMTLVDFYKVYAPSSDNNNPLNYATCVANDLGVFSSTKIGSLYAPESIKKPETIPEPTPVAETPQNTVLEAVEPSSTVNPTQQTGIYTAEPKIEWNGTGWTLPTEKYNQNNLFELIIKYLVKLWNLIKKR